MSGFHWRKFFSCYKNFRNSNYCKISTKPTAVTGGILALALLTGLAQESKGSQAEGGFCKSPINRNSSMPKRIPCAFIPHGGGPLPILGDKQHIDMVNWLSKFTGVFLSGDNKPNSVLVISAHWEEKQTTIQSGETTELYYDYYGFPEESYNLKYSLTGATELSKRVVELLKAADIPHKVDKKRGYDHGVFIPMKIIYPDGKIPTVQLSLVSGLDPKTHIKLGEALAPLRDEGVFILGSGMSYHNMRGFSSSESNRDSEPFHEYLRSSLTQASCYESRKEALEKWASAPKARDCHPREEHLIPLHVILGATVNDDNISAKEEFYADVAGVKCAGYVFK